LTAENYEGEAFLEPKRRKEIDKLTQHETSRIHLSRYPFKAELFYHFWASGNPGLAEVEPTISRFMIEGQSTAAFFTTHVIRIPFQG